MIIAPKYIWLDKTTSTNSALAAIANECEHGTVIATHNQTAGRGQRGNTWEAQPGENLTFSILLRPLHISPRDQFAISEIVSVAIVNVLRNYITTQPIAIKWPNDIYVNDLKICGILIENALSASCITHSIAGIGINVNQQHFLSDAPNPVSIVNITHSATNLVTLLDQVCCEILRLSAWAITPETLQQLHAQYCSMLWRRSGFHCYFDCIANQPIQAQLDNVATNGILSLRLQDGQVRSYAFKEIKAIL